MEVEESCSGICYCVSGHRKATSRDLKLRSWKKQKQVIVWWRDGSKLFLEQRKSVPHSSRDFPRVGKLFGVYLFFIYLFLSYLSRKDESLQNFQETIVSDLTF